MDNTKIKATIVDGDNTLWKGRALEGIGKSYLLRELKRLHLSTFYKGYQGVKEVMSIVKELRGVEGEMKGQQRFYEVLIENHLGRKDEMQSFVRDYMKRHLMNEVVSLVNKNKQDNIPVFLSTASGSTAAEFIVQYFEMKDRVSNIEVFNSTGKLVDTDMVITTGEKKFTLTASMLEKYDIKINECAMVGDSSLDVPLLKSAKVAIASPLANEEVKAIKGIVRLSSAELD